MARPGGKFEFVIDAPGVSPDTVDPVLVSGLAHEWFKTMLAVAKEMQADLRFAGFHALPGSMRILTSVNSTSTARVVDRKSRKYLEGREVPPPGTDRQIVETRRRFRVLPGGFAAKTSVGRMTPQPIRLPQDDPAWNWSSTTTLRAQVRDIHGGETPSVRFLSPSEPAPFTVRATKEQIIALAQLLYQPLDVTVRIIRDPAGAIDPRHSSFVEARKMDAIDPTEAWSEWLRRTAPEWDEISDVEAELARQEE